MGLGPGTGRNVSSAFMARVQGGRVTAGMGTILQDVETELTVSLCSFIQQTPIKQLFCAKRLSESRPNLSLWS